ncbi:hypothetical protein GIB67_026651 [Kingdonia uniflora]|uniref:Aminotransferase-like plant mobile domain-containing protein n=1 Tax=Kingdonia uniflora TaxID=39325 RepID=A0A7J7NIS1_9MAGN|nr:hypothetical protein GIB67_026651 [Kingdonia uniflora]
MSSKGEPQIVTSQGGANSKTIGSKGDVCHGVNDVEGSGEDMEVGGTETQDTTEYAATAEVLQPTITATLTAVVESVMALGTTVEQLEILKTDLGSFVAKPTELPETGPSGSSPEPIYAVETAPSSENPDAKATLASNGTADPTPSSIVGEVAVMEEPVNLEVVPVDESILIWWGDHCTKPIVEGQVTKFYSRPVLLGKLVYLKCHHYAMKWDLKREEQWVIDEVIKTGLGRLGEIAYEHHNAPLTTLFVEYWQAETNNFHFHFSVMTILLEDVFWLVGLKVKGKVTFQLDNKKDYDATAKFSSALTPTRKDYNETKYNNPKAATIFVVGKNLLGSEEMVKRIRKQRKGRRQQERRTCCPVSTTRRWVPLRCGKICMEAAALAYTYREMGVSSMKVAMQFTGLTMLLEVELESDYEKLATAKGLLENELPIVEEEKDTLLEVVDHLGGNVVLDVAEVSKDAEMIPSVGLCGIRGAAEIARILDTETLKAEIAELQLLRREAKIQISNHNFC